MSVDMAPEAVEARLCEASAASTLSLVVKPRVDMRPESVEARLLEWAEMTCECLALADRR